MPYNRMRVGELAREIMSQYAVESVGGVLLGSGEVGIVVAPKGGAAIMVGVCIRWVCMIGGLGWAIFVSE